jgi:hypothetical protein
MKKIAISELIQKLQTAGCVISTRLQRAKADHHLWKNNDGTWNMKFTIHTSNIKERFDISLQTKSFVEACYQRDYFFTTVPHSQNHAVKQPAKGFYVSDDFNSAATVITGKTPSRISLPTMQTRNVAGVDKIAAIQCKG